MDQIVRSHIQDGDYMGSVLVAKGDHVLINRRFSGFPGSWNRIEVTIRVEIGPALIDQLLAESQTRYGIAKRKHALKNPLVITEVLKATAAARHSSGTLTKIVGQVLNLMNPAAVEASAA